MAIDMSDSDEICSVVAVKAHGLIPDTGYQAKNQQQVLIHQSIRLMK
jgi:hypothetical protein